MHLYEVRTSNDFALPIFARDPIQAMTIFSVYHLDNRGGGMLPNLSIERLDHSPKITNKQHLADALAREIAGVGTIDPGAGWNITPVNELGEDG